MDIRREKVEEVKENEGKWCEEKKVMGGKVG